MSDSLNNSGSTPKSLISFMITACFGRIVSSDTQKLEQMKPTFKHMLENERKSNPDQDSTYDELETIVDKFFEYISRPDIHDRIVSGEISKNDLSELFFTEGLNMPKRKYDMTDLYREDLIAPSKEHPGRRAVTVHGRTRGGIPYTYQNKDGQNITIKDIGSIGYKEWGGVRAGLTIYQVAKEQEDGSVVSNIVCSSISIADMDIPEYREAVLEELLSSENIIDSKVQPYVGRVKKMERQGRDDQPHTEWQDGTGYYYRVNDLYVLEYDPTELSAVMEARRNSHLNKQNSQKSQKDHSKNTERKVTDFHDGHDEI